MLSSISTNSWDSLFVTSSHIGCIPLLARGCAKFGLALPGSEHRDGNTHAACALVLDALAKIACVHLWSRYAGVAAE